MGKLALFVDHPICSVDSINAVIGALETKHTFKLFTRHRIPYTNFFDDVDCVIFPGGIGDVDAFDRVLKNNREMITRYLEGGGHYLGICMGAYWAGPSYFNILKNLDCVQYMKRSGSGTFRPHPKEIDITWNHRKEKMYWYDGCSVVGNGSFKTVAAYPNGDPMAGYQGRVGVIGCHPEANQDWYDCHSWMKKKWTTARERNWVLLSNFVDELIKR